MKSFLNRVDKYIKENGIPFKTFEISYTYLPKYIDYAITCMMRETQPIRYEIAGCEKYIIGYDDNDNIYLKGIGSDGRTTIVVYSEYVYSNYNLSHVHGSKVSESDLYRKACILKIRENLREKIDKKFPNMSKFDRIKQVFEIMNEINQEDIKMLYNIEDEEIDKELDKSVDKIINYIDYVNKSYDEDIQAYLEEKIIEIKYNKPDSDTVIRKTRENTNQVKDRVNAIIPKNERLKVLSDYSPIHFGIAYSSNSKNSDYYCFLYYDYEKRPILVLESSSGTNYTKVFLLDNEIFYDEESFAEICKKYLELSNDEALKTGKIIRFKHCNIEKYDRNLDLVINGEKENIKYHP